MMEPLAALDRPAGLLAGRGYRHACARCTAGDARERTKMLQLLALIEHPQALPPELALRAAAELLRLTRARRGPFPSGD